MQNQGRKKVKQQDENNGKVSYLVYNPPKDPGQLYLEELGYRQIFRRKLGIYDLIFFNICFIQSSQIIYQFIGTGFSQNTPLNMLIAYVIIVAFNIIISATIAEIISAYPTCGSFYTVTFLLSPKNICQQLSLICGYLIYFGNLQLVSMLCIEWFEQIFTLMQYSGFDLNIINHTTFLIVGSLFTGLIVNLAIFSLTDIKMQIFIIASFIVMMLFFLISLIFLWKFAPGTSNQDIIYSSGESFGFSSWNILLIFKLWVFTCNGQGVCVNISEETKQPQNIQAKSIIISYLISSLMGLATLLTFIYTINIKSVQDYKNLTKDPSTFAILKNIFTNVSYDGELFVDTYSVRIIMVISIINLFFMMITTNMVVIKQQFALIRDGAYIGSKYIYNVESNNYNKVFLINFFLNFILQVIGAFSNGTKQLLINSYTLMITLTYLVPIILKLSTNKNDFKKHKFDLGKLSRPFGYLSICFLIFECGMCCLPNTFEKDESGNIKDFNWAVLYVICFIIIILFLYYCPKFGLEKKMRGPNRWDDKFGINKKKKTNFQKVQELYALVENRKGIF